MTGVAIVAGAVLLLRLLTWEWSGDFAKNALSFPVKPGQDLWQFWQETKNKFQSAPVSASLPTGDLSQENNSPAPEQESTDGKKWLEDLKTQLENVKK